MKKMRSLAVGLLLAVALLVILGPPGPVSADESIRARLHGFEEVIPGQTIGAVSTEASGSFRGKISKDEDSIEFELSYDSLEGTVSQAHIHFGQKHTQGGISVFLCQTAGSPDPTGAADPCPQLGSVTGTLTAANVIGPANQGIAVGEFNELVGAIRAGVTYVNVHSTKFPGGEIRGQIKASRGKQDDD